MKQSKKLGTPLAVPLVGARALIANARLSDKNFSLVGKSFWVRSRISRGIVDVVANLMSYQLLRN
jgi:hypothetical protein